MLSQHEYYSERIERLTPLSFEDEREMFVAYRRRRTAKRREEITRRFLYWAAEIACRYCGPRMPKADAISAGNLGLMQAIEDFDPDKGKRFTTHSYFAIRRTVLVALRDTYTVDPSPGINAARHVFNKSEKTDADNKTFMDAKRKVFDQVGGVELGNQDQFGRKTDRAGSPENDEEPLSTEDCRAEADRSSMLEFVRAKIAILPPIERTVMTKRYLGDKTPLFREIGAQLDLEEDHVRYLHDRALEKIREALKKEIE